MKKLIAGLTVGAAMLFTVSPVFAKVERVAGPWQLSAPQEISFVCGGNSYVHTLGTVNNLPDGSYSGTGYYNPDMAYIWDIDGNVVGNDITFQIEYTGTAAGSVYNGVGTIAPDGSITGTVDSNCETFTMAADSVTHFSGNHGQYVRSQDDKQAAAQSRIGMPVKSQGHK